MLPDNAIGFIRSQMSADLDADVTAVRATAEAKGLDLPEVLIFGRDEAQPLLLLLDAVHRLHATTVIMPEHAHTNGGQRALDEAHVSIVYSGAAQRQGPRR